MNMLADTVPATLDVPTLTQQLESIGISELDHVMIEDLTMIDSLADFATTLPLRLDRMGLNQPIDDIQIVDVLFVDVVTTQPGEVIPVPHLVLQFRLLGRSRANPNAAAVPISTCEHQITNRTVVQFVDAFPVTELVMPLQSDLDRDSFFLRLLVRGQDSTYTWRVGRNRFFHEDMFACFDRRLELHRAEARRRRQNHEVDIGLQHLLVSVEPNEAVVVDIHLLRMLALDRAISRLQVVLEDVGHRDQLDTTSGCVERLDSGARSATTATDQADVDDVAAKSVCTAGDAQIAANDCAPGQHHAAALEEITA